MAFGSHAKEINIFSLKLKPAKHTIRYVAKIRISTAVPRVAIQRPVRNTQFLDITKYWGKNWITWLLIQNSCNRSLKTFTKLKRQKWLGIIYQNINIKDQSDHLFKRRYFPLIFFFSKMQKIYLPWEKPKYSLKLKTEIKHILISKRRFECSFKLSSKKHTFFHAFI